MKIGIILHPYGESKPGGLARTIFEWTNGLLEIDRENEYIIFLKNQPVSRPNFPGANWRIEILGDGWFWKDRLKYRSRADVYIFQTPVLPLFYRPPKSIIITQDYPYYYLSPHNLGERLRNILTRLYHRHSLRRADLIVAVSKSSKSDTIRFFNLPEEKVEVVYMGYKDICAVPAIEIPLPDKFFLFVGVIKERKNFLNVFKAFAQFKRDNDSSVHKLVVAGKTGNDYFRSVEKDIDLAGLHDRIIFLEYLNDGQLSYVYQRAEALIFPSLVESFGFPCLEAMSCGVPVITTKYQGPAEIVDRAGILVNPNNFMAIAQAMEKIVQDQNLRRRLVEAGLARAKEFSWPKAAAGLLRALERII